MALTKSKLIKLNNVAQQCVIYLNRNKGIQFTKAEDMVLEIIKESHHEIQSGNIDLVIATLKMTFLDQTVEQASNDILKSIFK